MTVIRATTPEFELGVTSHPPNTFFRPPADHADQLTTATQLLSGRHVQGARSLNYRL